MRKSSGFAVDLKGIYDMIGAGIDLVQPKPKQSAEDILHEVRCALLDQATDVDLTALAHRRRAMKLRNKIAAFYGQK
jgi:hypothetical protein